MKTKPHSNACDMEVNQDPSKLWYELLALQLMQFPGMWLGVCRTEESSKPSFSTPQVCILARMLLGKNQKLLPLLAAFWQQVQNW